mmetsp:Transcript_49550/g.114820  ORF Transcript_49550/g.114820 Transcript_49550/m.114820 type:complete len:207 (+) Transcript_49550:74-694(+)|eukprot:CAMPEP_0171057206 /NCGR_PEP_ID=MMETSP0766_2-20121228/1622_1 /TAXON_ID=439317 /ORGANISM="Gambierdiscus australes, Strain CAWD 149" /LENGTH=206 /DNA_ID=CAMNT_0011512261 /DNA_START=72 /DNA_END=692 /DNA_ORIENTATION=+
MLSSSSTLLLLVSLPSAVSLGIIAKRDASACPCLNWSEVYGKGGISCAPGIGGLAGDEFCNFMRNLHSNVCVERQFMSRDHLADSVCYVSAQCAGQTHMTRKTCRPNEDVLLTELPLTKSTAIAKKNGVDQGCMAGYGGIYVDKLVSELSRADIEGYKSMGQPVFIWSMRDHFGPRLQIKGQEVFRHTFNPSAPGYWDVTCEEGCK